MYTLSLHDALTIYKITPDVKAIRGFVFSKIKPITTKGTINKYGDMLKVFFIVWSILLISALPVVSLVILKILNINNVIIMVGTVVIAIYLIWVNKSVPAMAGAKFVVSLKGDILSPK